MYCQDQKLSSLNKAYEDLSAESDECKNSLNEYQKKSEELEEMCEKHRTKAEEVQNICTKEINSLRDNIIELENVIT